MKTQFLDYGFFENLHNTPINIFYDGTENYAVITGTDIECKNLDLTNLVDGIDVTIPDNSINLIITNSIEYCENPSYYIYDIDNDTSTAVFTEAC
jgi:hypothetical protein